MRNYTDVKMQESHERKEHTKRFETNSFLPAIEKLAALISAQANMMTKMHSAINGKVKERQFVIYVSKEF